ncbi:MAG: hypothetical protein KDI50_09830 [Candidatus Competibacteraceae bacterium]|nr:hypothetical protein [Candidatus Competibacteraceae bacterium]
MRTCLPIVGLFLGLFSAAGATGEIPEIFLPLDDAGAPQYSLTMGQRTGYYRVRLNTRLRSPFTPLSAVRLSLPRGVEYTVIKDKQIAHASGSFTWVGFIEGCGNNCRVIITTRQGQAFGRILTQDGEFLLESHRSGTWLIDPHEAGWLSGNRSDDALAPPFTDELSPLDPATDKRLPTFSGESLAQTQADASSTVDVMLLYTAGMAERYGSGLQARLDHLVDIANLAYSDSLVALTLRLVQAVQVSYSDTTSNETALYTLTDGSDAALADVAAWRNQYGADLVALLRPFSNASHNGCGIAWINGGGGQALNASFGYAVVSDGDDVGGSLYYCDTYSLTHELGHTMGSVHDRANTSNVGAYAYSYGYGVDGLFGTIMSYIRPTVGKFSNPNLNCSDSQACGIANDADNALSLNNTRTAVAGFKTIITDQLTLENTTVTEEETHVAHRTITAGAAYTVSSTGDVTLRAGERIILQPWFRVQMGGRFRAEIDSSLIP